MTHYITDRNGTRHRIEENGWDKTHAYIYLDGYKPMKLKMYYRHERTWDDHMGNTPCGYYVNVPITCYINQIGYKKETHRVYLEFR